MTANETAAQLEAILAGADAGDVVSKLRAVLNALPADESSAKDQHLRATLEGFIAGYELGSKGHAECTGQPTLA